MRRNEKNGSQCVLGCESKSLIPGTVLHDIVPRLAWTVCHIVSILTVLHEMVFGLSLACCHCDCTKGIDTACCGLCGE